ncbi:MAG: hypothetical protein IPO08_20635 [Xanthomonadales bacterium]|nr:hypothetical protein [Xanthomonadales bacterium]
MTKQIIITVDQLQSAVDMAATMVREGDLCGLEPAFVAELLKRGAEMTARARWGTLPAVYASWDEMLSDHPYLENVREWVATRVTR